MTIEKWSSEKSRGAYETNSNMNIKCIGPMHFFSGYVVGKALFKFHTLLKSPTFSTKIGLFQQPVTIYEEKYWIEKGLY